MNYPTDLPKLFERSAHTLFFDDVRTEMSGKLILVGVYPYFFSVLKFPTSIKVKALISASSPQENLFKKFRVHAFYNDNLVLSEDVPREYFGGKYFELSEPTPLEFDHPDLVPAANFQAIYELDFLAERPGFLRIRIETESEIIPAGALQIQSVDNRT